MGTLTRSLVVTLAFVFAVTNMKGAELKLSVVTDRFGLIFADESISIRVNVSALDVSERELVRMNAHERVGFTVALEGSQPRPLSVTPGRSLMSSFAPVTPELGNGIAQRLWTESGIVTLPALPGGRYTVKGSYQELDASVTFVVWNGNENADVAASLLGRKAESASSYAEFRRLQLERLELQPLNSAILWELASRAEYEAPLEETDTYYARMIEVRRAALARQELNGANLEEQRRDLEVFEHMIAAVRNLLPEFYRKRESLTLEKPAPRTNATVNLVDRTTRKTLRSIDGFALPPDPSVEK